MEWITVPMIVVPMLLGSPLVDQARFRPEALTVVFREVKPGGDLATVIALRRGEGGELSGDTPRPVAVLSISAREFVALIDQIDAMTDPETEIAAAPEGGLIIEAHSGRSLRPGSGHAAIIPRAGRRDALVHLLQALEPGNVPARTALAVLYKPTR